MALMRCENIYTYYLIKFTKLITKTKRNFLLSIFLTHTKTNKVKVTSHKYNTY